MRELIVVRHGESEGNVAGIIQGRSDHALTARGERQALAIADVVRDMGWQPARVVASPTRRCAQTAGIISKRLQLPAPSHREAFDEVDVGSIAGRPWKSIGPRAGSGFARWGGESVDQLFARVGEGMETLGDDESVLLVTHGAVVKGVLAHVLGLRSRYRLDLRNGTVVRLAGSTWTHLLHAEEWKSS